MSDSPMYDAIDAVMKPPEEKALMFPPSGPLASTQRKGVPVERIDAEGGHYRLDYSGRFFCGYEWVPE